MWIGWKNTWTKVVLAARGNSKPLGTHVTVGEDEVLVSVPGGKQIIEISDDVVFRYLGAGRDSFFLPDHRK